METTIEKITPMGAESYLATMTSNRRLSKAQVVKYAKHMTNKEWKLSGEAIKFSKDGALIDGQHRLRALILANVTVEFMVVRGLDEDVFTVIDTGKVRSLADVLFISGYTKYSNAMASSVRIFYKYKTFGLEVLLRDSKTALTRGISNDKLLDFAETNSIKIINSTKTILKWHRMGALVPVGLASALHCMFSDVDVEDADYFMNRLLVGDQLEDGEPIFTLRKRLSEVRLKGHKLQQNVTLALVCKGWNNYRDGVSRIKYYRMNEFVKSLS